MGRDQSATLRCAKCSTPPGPSDAACPNCGGRIVKVCGGCAFQNSPAKKFCDQCGDRLNLTSAPPSPPAQKMDTPVRPAEPPPKPRREEPPPKLPPIGSGSPPPPKRDIGIPGIEEAPPGFDLRPPETRPKSGGDDSTSNVPLTSIVRLGDSVPKGGKPPAVPTGYDPFRGPPPGVKAPPGPAKAAGAPRKPEPLGPRKPLLPPGWGSKISMALAVVLLVSGAVLWGMRWNRGRRPDVAVPLAANRYLSAIRSADLASAYAMLTEASRRGTTLEEFKKVRDGVNWDFADLRLASVDGDTAFVKYELRAAGRPPEQAAMVFVREGDRWARPYVGGLLAGIEDALTTGAPDKARRLAETAVQIDRLDPQSQSYLCESVYYLRDTPRIEAECRTALSLSERVPEPLKLPPAVRFHVHAILGDTFKNLLNRPGDSVAEYAEVLSDPNLRPESRCEMLLGRAEAGVSSEAFPTAVKDFEAAAKACQVEADLLYARRGASVFSGQAGTDALQLVQQYRLAGGQTVLAWRRQARGELETEWQKAGRGQPPDEAWSSEHVSGPNYRVTLKAAQATLFSARADLWRRGVKLETQ